MLKSFVSIWQIHQLEDLVDPIPCSPKPKNSGLSNDVCETLVWENGGFGGCFPSFWGPDGGPWDQSWGRWPPGTWIRPKDAANRLSGKFWAAMTWLYQSYWNIQFFTTTTAAFIFIPSYLWARGMWLVPYCLKLNSLSKGHMYIHIFLYLDSSCMKYCLT